MKNKDYSILLYLIVLGIAILAASCSKTNDPAPKPVYKDIAGDWTYTTAKTKADFTIEHIGSEFVVTKATVGVWKTSGIAGFDTFTTTTKSPLLPNFSSIHIWVGPAISQDMLINIAEISKDFTIIVTSSITAFTPITIQDETVVTIKRK